MVYANSLSNTLLPLLQVIDRPLTCLSRHDHACNFQTAGGAIIALVTPRHGNGPFHIVLPHPLPPLLTSSNNLRAQWRQGTLHIGSLQIMVQQAAVWAPDLPVLRSLSTNAFVLLHESSAHYPLSALFIGTDALRKRAQQGADAIQTGFTHGDFDQVQSGVTALAGLGPGLTPAGDDFLLGLLAALHGYRLQRTVEQPNFCRFIAQAAVPHTTQLSARWLACAGEGHFSEAWHHLIAALNNGASAAITIAAHRILTTGATSGVDAMSGFLFGIGLLEDTRQGDTRQETRKK